jgi:hypothetical protein
LVRRLPSKYGTLKKLRGNLVFFTKKNSVRGFSLKLFFDELCLSHSRFISTLQIKTIKGAYLGAIPEPRTTIEICRPRQESPTSSAVARVPRRADREGANCGADPKPSTEPFARPIVDTAADSGDFRRGFGKIGAAAADFHSP